MDMDSLVDDQLISLEMTIRTENLIRVLKACVDTVILFRRIDD